MLYLIILKEISCHENVETGILIDFMWLAVMISFVLYRQQLMSELTSNGVHIYQFPTDDETVAEVNTTMNVSSIALMWLHFYKK